MNKNTNEQKLIELNRLKNKGLINDDEYVKKREEILSKI